MALSKLTSNDALKNWREKLNEVIDELDTRSPINHAVPDKKYGIGTEENYGHVRLIDDIDIIEEGDYDKNRGVAASPLAVKKVYDIVKSALTINESGIINTNGIINAKGFIGDLEGNASSATLAEMAVYDSTETPGRKDENGNEIKQQPIHEKYVTKTEIINGRIEYSGSIKQSGKNIQWRDILTDVGVNSSFIYQTTYKGYMPALNLQTQDGRIGFGTYQDFCRWDCFKANNDTNTPNSYIDLTPTSVTIFANLNVSGKSVLKDDLNITGNIIATKDIIGDRVFNAEWNDYAEFFERGCETEVGDIIALDLSSDEERYVKASKENSTIVGVHSDTYGHILGGKDSIKESEETHIPVGLVGRVKTKIVGKIKKGEFVVLSGIPGVGCAYDEKLNSPLDVFGVAVENSDDTGIKLVKIKLK